MQLSYTLAVVVFGIYSSAALITERAIPHHDVYLLEDEKCEGPVLAMKCENLQDGDCCNMPPRGTIGNGAAIQFELAGSAAYTEPGASIFSNLYEIKGYTVRAAQDVEACSLQIAKDDRCATAGSVLTLTGAIVHSGSGTITRKARGKARVVTASKIVYLSGKKEWSVDVNSDAGREVLTLPKHRRAGYLRERGKVRLLH